MEFLKILVFLVGLTTITLVSMFYAIKISQTVHSKIKTKCLQYAYETPYERRQRRLKKTKRPLPRKLKFKELEVSSQANTYEEQAIVKARWLLEDLNE